MAAKEELPANCENRNLDIYLNNAIRNIMTNAYRAALSNPGESLFILKMKSIFAKAEKRRKRFLTHERLHIPPFLISSIATDCNLACKGCYARSHEICGVRGENRKEELTPEQWRKIFTEAARAGVVFNLLAGGEPLLRKDILEAAASVKDMIFPLFTNGTLINDYYVKFFSKHLNLIPVLSLEGEMDDTDGRRGQGVFDRVVRAMKLLKERGLLYGASITVTTENLDTATALSYVNMLGNAGCKIIFYVEYVPVEDHTSHLALDEKGISRMETRLENLRKQRRDVLFLSFPGDEKAMGGCLAAGRGFFHISPDGKAEACPFSPYSDSNVAHLGFMETLKSPFFARLRDSGLVGGTPHTGGCTLFEYREEVENAIKHRITQ
ncbi:MAG: radical SAM protein [Tannerella sp.]|jgi:MoaA/NifB/PqqE/SkfB family radical SAM enzyme|nr:radical SAM protein [Tannerella sp.]